MKPADRPILLLRLFQLLALLGALPFLANTVDIILHPQALSLDAVMGSRILSGLLVAPLTLAIAILCIRRAPGNMIGWMLVTFAYGVSSLSMRLDLLPLGLTILIGSWFVATFWISFLLIPLYFPTGQLYPPAINRWANPLIAAIIFFLVFVTNIFSPTLSFETSIGLVAVPNPFYVVDWDYTAVTIPLMLGFLLAGVVTLSMRYRDGQQLERLQIRWLFFGILVQALLTLPILILPDDLDRFVAWISGLYIVIIPTAIGFAVLRYRLYDIDVIIRRTLVYTLLTGVLGMVYFGCVILLQEVLRIVTGGTGQSPLAVVASTLAIAALFNPLRLSIQHFIDRRFFRQRYNSEQILQSFARTLRSETDLEQIHHLLLTVVQETIQPARADLWIFQAGARTPERQPAQSPAPIAVPGASADAAR